MQLLDYPLAWKQCPSVMSVMTLTSSGNSSPTKDMMSDVFPTLAVGEHNKEK